MASIDDLRPLLDRVRRDVCWLMTPGAHPYSVKTPITKDKLKHHLNGGPYCGAAFIQAGEDTTRVGLLDLDSHGGEVAWPDMLRAVEDLDKVFRTRGGYPTVFRSTGGRGVHMYLIWDEPQDAYSVRTYLNNVLLACGYRSGTKGVVDGQIEVFPKQDGVAEGKLGNMAILPLAGKSRFLDPMLDFEESDEAPQWVPSLPVPVLKKPERELVAVEPSVELAEFRAALDGIPNTEDKALDYDAWRNVVFSIHHATGGSDEGLAMAHEFSARSGKYDPEFLDNRVWPYIDAGREGGITDRYVVALAREHGWSDVSAEDFDVLPPEEDDFEALPEPEQEGEKNRFTVVATAQFADAPPPRWHVKGLLPESELVVMYGASGSGKSFMALDLAAAIVEGEEWRGRRVRKGRVVYVCAEGAGGFRTRVKAHIQQHTRELRGLGVIPVAPNFLLKDDVLDVARAIKAWGGADLVVLDTWAQVLPGANENSGEDIGKALGHCKGLRRATGATVMLVHHSGKDESKGARGWSGLKAAADAELEVLRAGEDRLLSVTKMKDGVEGDEFGFRLSPITIGLDEDGDEIVSCVVVEHGTSRQSLREGSQRTKNRRGVPGTALRVLTDNMIDTTGGIDRDYLIQAIIEALPEPTGKRDLRKQHAIRALKDLETDGAIEVRGLFVHLPKPA